MRVLLVAAPHADTFGYSMPPPGLLRLAGELLRRGTRVGAEDLAYRLASGALPRDDRLAEASAAHLLAGGAPDVLGISVMGATVPIAIALTRHVRERSPGTRIVLGGPGTSGIDALLLERFPWIDVVVRGEGEITLPALLARWIEGREPEGVAGVTRRRAPDGGIVREPDRAPIEDLDALPDYAWELFPSFEDYARLAGGGEGLLPVDSGRGCVYDCAFCSIGRYWSRRSRVLSVDRLLDEVAHVRAVPGARRAYLCHDLFGTPRAHALAFCRGMIERGIDVPWECRARVDHLDAELIELMGRAGCYRVLVGVESADPIVRARSGKAFAPATDLLDVVERLGRAGIVPILSFILGLPGEGEGELRSSLELALAASLRTGLNLSLHLVNPQPGCALGEEYAASSGPVEGISPDMALGAGETREERELIREHPDLFSTWSLLSALPGGAERLRELSVIASRLPGVLMHRPRTLARLARGRGLDTLDVYRRWVATDLPFDEFALASAGADASALASTLAWEQAVEHPPEEGSVIVRTSDEPLAVMRTPRGVRTLRVSADVARLIELHATDPTALDDLREARDRLMKEGLIPTR